MKRVLAVILVCLVPVLIAARRRSVRSGSGNLPGRDFERFVLAGSLRHDFLVYVPSSYDGSRAVPVVLFFHGGGGNARQGEDTVHLRATAERHGFILVEPEGYDGSGLGLRTWNAGACCSAAVRDGVDHVGAVRAILDSVASEWRIDSARVFATGHSNGGMMAYRLACELSDRITAIAPNSAALSDTDLDANPPRAMFACTTPSRPVPVMHMHGDADTCMPVDGGVSTGLETSTRPPLSYSINRFVAIDHAATTPRLTYQNDDVTCVTHDGPQRADVVLCTARGGGHAWPGADYTGISRVRCGGAAIRGLDANEAIWQFFSTR
jgi:polyhydroxybutyrate depolymerase